MTLPLPPAPSDVKSIPADLARSLLGEWLMKVARQCGEPSIDRALGKDWPGTKEQRALLHDTHIELARNEARQLGLEVSYRDLKVAGKWGV